MRTTATALVVREVGSEWPSLGREVSNSIAISDDGTGNSARLLFQVLRGLQTRELPADRIEIAALACNGNAADWTAARRVELARLLQRMLGAGGGKLLLTAPSEATPTLRLQLLGIADDLVTRRMPRSRGAVEVHFGGSDSREKPCRTIRPRPNPELQDLRFAS
jgi:hypothetical protein